MTRFTLLMTILTLASAPVAVFAAESNDAEPAAEMEDRDPDPRDVGYRINELPAGYRIFAPRYLYEKEAEFTVWVPKAKKGESFALTVRAGGKLLASPVVIPGEDVKKPAVATVRLTVDASDWPDGVASARLWPAGEDAEAAEDKKARPLAETDVRIVRKWVDETFSGEDKAELAVWLKHANRPRDIWKKVPRWQTLDRVMRDAGLLWNGLDGLVLRSYVNPQLERRMPYAVYVPEAYDPSEPMALMILLHGSGGTYLNIVSDMVEGQEMESYPMLVANAGAFPTMEYRHLALNDVMHVIDDMKAKYNVDADRVYTQGISLGGRGAMEMAALRPGVFAAISPQGTYGTMQEPNDIPFFLTINPYARWTIAKWDLRSVLPNLQHTPMEIIYGHRDRTTPPLNALTYRHLLNKRFGGKAIARGFDRDHNISWPDYKWSETRAWLLKNKRVTDPATIHARTASLRYNRFYWVTIERMKDYWRMADVAATFQRSVLIVRTDNVTRMTLEPPKSYEHLFVDGQEMKLENGGHATLRFARDDEGKWTLVDSGAEAEDDKEKGLKRHGLSGPIWDMMNGRCLAVYGTGGSEAETKGLEKLARRVARLDVAWGERSWPVLADTEVTEAQRAAYDLILVGDARTNKLLTGHKWPFDLQKVGKGEGIEVFGETYNEPADTLTFIHPSPFAADRYILAVVVARPDAERHTMVHPAATWDIAVWCDWVVRGRRPDASGGRGSALDSGVFDGGWRLEKMPGPLVQPRPMNWE